MNLTNFELEDAFYAFPINFYKADLARKRAEDVNNFRLHQNFYFRDRKCGRLRHCWDKNKFVDLSTIIKRVIFKLQEINKTT